jgi:hypothetical protein
MRLEEIEEMAVALPEIERASLVCRLLDTLPPPAMEVSDEEVARREAELESGAVEALEHDEFVRRVDEERRR